MSTRARAKEAAVTLVSLPDDIFEQIIAASETSACGIRDGVLFAAVKGLVCSKALLQLHRLRPLVGVRSLAVVQRPAHGPWRVVLLYEGELTAAVLEQARQGRVRSIASARQTSLAISSRLVVPELLGAGCSLLDLDLSCVQLNGTWASIFGEAAVCSAALCKLRLLNCGLRGPLPELRLPALQVLDLSFNLQVSGGLEPLRACTALRALFLHDNQMTGGLEPLRGCTALEVLYLCSNQLSGDLEPLRSCTALQRLDLESNQLTGGIEPLTGCTGLQTLFLRKNNQLVPTDEDMTHFEKQGAMILI